ncbi:helix-turn-helix domain-containing protein [Streptomyces sp. NPDC127110]|uniref:helix-turn-helix domain-containing protein n=1 Tax=Streptomyces sp. NPDC127110 TaxID=3345362 RepID=UPI003642D4C1
MTGEDRTALYRLFDESGHLLYVGVTAHPQNRWKTHRTESSWWDEVRLREIEWLPSRVDALIQEAAEIAARRPRYNKHPGRSTPSAGETRSVKHQAKLGEVPRARPSGATEQELAEFDRRVEAKLRGPEPVVDGLPGPAERAAIRQAARWKQSDVAELLQVHRLTVSAWEQGKSEPRGESRKRYIYLLDKLKARADGAPQPDAGA